MNHWLSRSTLSLVLAASFTACDGGGGDPLPPNEDPCPVAKAGEDDSFALCKTSVTYVESLDLLVFEQDVRGVAGATTPVAVGQLDGAPVLGYVFPTTLKAEDVGFSAVEGIVALAVTAHPDFDDTPLWDENNSGKYDDDGIVFHPHWVVLNPDDRAPKGLAVKEIAAGADATLPPTNPGMPMYMDSPGFSVTLRDHVLRVLVPAKRVNGKVDFHFDGVTALMKVVMDPAKPMLGVYEVYSVQSGDLSLPFATTHRAGDVLQ
jgi:hypothetical protein